MSIGLKPQSWYFPEDGLEFERCICYNLFTLRVEVQRIAYITVFCMALFFPEFLRQLSPKSWLAAGHS